MSRWKLALGAASLFFFVVGVKRSFRTDDGREILQSDADLLEEQREQAKQAGRGGASGSQPLRSRAESEPRSAGSGRLSTLLEKAEKETRSSREAGRGRKGDREQSPARNARRDPDFARKPSR